jgi:hypothetical protein
MARPSHRAVRRHQDLTAALAALSVGDRPEQRGVLEEQRAATEMIQRKQLSPVSSG